MLLCLKAECKVVPSKILMDQFCNWPEIKENMYKDKISAFDFYTKGVVVQNTRIQLVHILYGIPIA